MFKWVEIGLLNNKMRFEMLSQFLKENGFENQVDFIQTTEEEFRTKLPEWLNHYDGIRIGRGLGEVVVGQFVNHTLMVDRIRAADALLKINGKWWPRSNAVDGFARVLAHVGERFDLDSRVLIVGAGAAARVAITSLTRLGFKHFVISNIDDNVVQNLIAEMGRNLLGIKLEMVSKDQLILLPGTHGVIVNTTPLTQDNPMLNELYYFNFFKKGGVAVDFSISPVETPLLIGAKDVGAFCVYGYQVSAATDLIWAEQVSGRSFAEATDYEKKLGDHLRSEDSKTKT
jgi:shikimate 5-dehydrogenase